MDKTVNIQLAANDVLAEVEHTIKMEYYWFGSVIFIAIASFWGAEIQATLLCILVIIWYLNKDLNEAKRLRETYGI